jgi:hypothetical protein
MNAQQKKSRILFLVDASSSMTLPWHEKETRWDAARKVILSVMDSLYAVNNEVEFAVRVYGSQSPAQKKDCYDTKLEVDFGLQNINQINTRLKSIKPMGSSPIAFSLKQSSENELSNTTKYDYSFILVTDGGESCGGDICDVYAKLIANKIKVNPFIIGLDTIKTLNAYYDCLGKYVSVTKPNEIASAVAIVKENSSFLTNKTKILGIKTNYSEVGQLEQPEWVGLPAELSFLVPIKAEKLFAQMIRVPKARLLSKTKQANPADYYVAERAPIDGIVNLNRVNAFKMANQYKQDKEGRKRNVKSTVIPPSWYEIEARPAVDIAAMMNKGMKALTVDAIKNSRASKKQYISWVKPNIVFERESIAIEDRLSAIEARNLPVKKPSVLKANNKLKFKDWKMPNLEWEREAIASNSVVSSMPAKKIELAPFKKVKMVSRKYIPTLPIIIEKEEQERVAMQPLFSNIFRLSYTPTKPQMPISRRYKMNKIFFPIIASTKPPVSEPTKTNEPPVFQVKSEVSSETKIQVYFTDGNGKYYKTKPDIAIVDPTTKNIKKTFVRTLLGGEPEPIKLDFDGIFDITVLGQKDIVLQNVLIEKDKTTKIILKVNKGTLTFTYRDDKNRPVELDAKVVLRNKGDQDSVAVRCNVPRMFEPGDYHIIVNVLPPYGVTTEISFDAVTEIQIAQLGAVQFTNTQNIGNIVLYAERNTNFQPFYTFNINGNVEKQKLELRPGLYQASFVEAGAPPNTVPTLMKFIVKSNIITDVELRFIGNNVVAPEGEGKLIYRAPAVNPNINIQTGETPKRKKNK